MVIFGDRHLCSQIDLCKLVGLDCHNIHGPHKCMNSQVWHYKCTLLVAFAGGWDCAWCIWCCSAKMNSWGVRRSWHGFTSAQLETWRLCRGVNKSSFCKSEHIKAYMRHVSGESQVLWRASSYHPSFRNPILYFPYPKTFGIMLHEIIIS